MDTITILKIVILLFDNFTALDVVGPYEVLNKLPNSKIYLVGLEKKGYKDTYGLEIQADYTLNEISQADIVLIPGGIGIDNLLNNKEVLDWLQRIDSTTKWTTSVCSGSLLLTQAGLLNGKECTSHWLRKDQLEKYDVIVKNERYVQDGKLITSAGVSAGIDMAIYLVSKVAGDQFAKIVQLAIEYDPQPPFDCGSPDKAPEEMVVKLKEMVSKSKDKK